MAKIAPHPTRSLAIGSACLGGACLALGAASGQLGPALFGLVFVGYGAFLGQVGPTTQVANLAAAAINRGDIEEARAFLAQARARRSLAAVKRLLDSHESEMAWREGDLASARRFADIALARKDLLPLQREQHRGHVHALRSIACAAAGDDAAAEESIAAVRTNTRASAGALARAELAFAVILARRGDLDSLHRHLAKHHVLLCESLEPRGRALHRALRRMAAVRSSSAYRVPVKQESTARVGTTRSWMARVFPQGEGLVDLDDATPPEHALAAPNEAQPMAPMPTTPSVKPRLGRALVLWVVLMVALVAIWNFFAIPGDPGRPAPPHELDFGFGFFVMFVVFAGLLWFVIGRNRRKQLVLEEASRALLSGELDRAETLARTLREDQNRFFSATSSLVLAGIFERRGDVPAALAECERGIAQLGGIARASASDVLLPQLVATRAHLFGALGREAESEGELARLARDFPAFPYAAGWVLRTRLLRAVRRGDLVEARALAKARGDVAVGAYVELVADMALVEESEDRDERMAAIREDLALMPELERWLRAVLPGYLEHALPRRS